MRNFIKTILSAFKLWTQKTIKESASDWNQNDPSAYGYVKNRTHWTESGIVTLVKDLTSSDYSNGNKPSCTFVIGEKYNIIWNGQTYKDLVCYLSGSYHVIADSSNGCPFYIDDDGGSGLYISSSSGSPWTVTIYQQKQIVHKLDSKYLDIPENVATTDDLENLAETVSEQIDAAFNGEKDYLILKDAVSGIQYKIQVKNGDLTSTVIASLDDFDYITNNDGTYTITGWKKTYLGNNSNIMVFPDDERVII